MRNSIKNKPPSFRDACEARRPGIQRTDETWLDSGCARPGGERPGMTKEIETKGESHGSVFLAARLLDGDPHRLLRGGVRCELSRGRSADQTRAERRLGFFRDQSARPGADAAHQ